MAINSSKNYFLEALKYEFSIKEIEIDYHCYKVIPVEYKSRYANADTVAYPPVARWTFDGNLWWSYVLTPGFRNEVVTLNFFSSTNRTRIDYDERSLIRVIELSKTCKDADELNTILHGRPNPPKPWLNSAGHMEVY
jgi:hypothetical protein